ncbi:glyoxal reductase-like [Osmia bicornis bicornis]|uniref:glyoxal reductase-like n=1 Tax=Osmia bicornis bicornis TaxID=1437191 RepID=UPI0010F44678|nr:glyoxal reductase-like [Osmia bicornis bicornis]
MNGRTRNVRLSSGYVMPLIGFGTYKIQGRETICDVVDESLKVGFRSIDTAVVYRNEEDIGYALTLLLPKYNLERSDIFITTKLSPRDHGNPERIEESVQKSLKALNTTYIDLYLIHWPAASRIPETSTDNSSLRAKTWRTLVDLKKQGFIRSVGVSNYTVRHLEELLHDRKGIAPAVNQVECHPHFRQEELIAYCNEKGVHVQAYSSLGTSSNTSLLTDPTVTKIASQLDVSPAQLLLKWALEQGIGIIPKAVQKEHIRNNMQLDFMIDEENMNALSSLPQCKYTWDPSNVY